MRTLACIGLYIGLAVVLCHPAIGVKPLQANSRPPELDSELAAANPIIRPILYAKAAYEWARLSPREALEWSRTVGNPEYSYAAFQQILSSSEFSTEELL